MVNPVMVILATMCSCRSRIIRAAENLPFLCNNNNNNKIGAGFCDYLTKQMGSWQKEKEHYLAMSAEQKRKGYASWQSIPAWKEFAIKEKLPDKRPMNTDFQINHSLNDRLAQKISLFMGDITTLGVDSIVNAANSSLLGGGGVDGAIHRAAGSDLKEECRTLNGCKVGEAKITGGYKLPSKYVIHTVGPQGELPNSLRDCYKNSLDLMLSKKLRTIAFPCISTGIYGYPNEPAAHVAAYAVRKHLEAHSDDVDRIIFCLFLDIDKEIYKAILQSYFPLN